MTTTKTKNGPVTGPFSLNSSSMRRILQESIAPTRHEPRAGQPEDDAAAEADAIRSGDRPAKLRRSIKCPQFVGDERGQRAAAVVAPGKGPERSLRPGGLTVFRRRQLEDGAIAIACKTADGG